MVVALALGAGSAAAESPKTLRLAGGWDQLSIGRLGPLGTSNSLFQLALNGSAPTATKASKAAPAGGTAGSDSTKGGVPMYVIAGGAAVGLGVFIAAVSGGSSADLVTNPTGGTPETPGGSSDTPGGVGGSNGGSTGGSGDGFVPSSGGTDTQGGSTGSVGPSDPPVTVTPEPASMALLASGLAGMGGFQLRRHRKRIEDQN